MSSRSRAFFSALYARRPPPVAFRWVSAIRSAVCAASFPPFVSGPPPRLPSAYRARGDRLGAPFLPIIVLVPFARPLAFAFLLRLRPFVACGPASRLCFSLYVVNCPCVVLPLSLVLTLCRMAVRFFACRFFSCVTFPLLPRLLLYLPGYLPSLVFWQLLH